jgi:hypothetical protein
MSDKHYHDPNQLYSNLNANNSSYLNPNAVSHFPENSYYGVSQPQLILDGISPEYIAYNGSTPGQSNAADHSPHLQQRYYGSGTQPDVTVLMLHQQHPQGEIYHPTHPGHPQHHQDQNYEIARPQENYYAPHQLQYNQAYSLALPPSGSSSGSRQFPSVLSNSPASYLGSAAATPRQNRENRAWTNPRVVPGCHVALLIASEKRHCKARPTKKGNLFCSHCSEQFRTILDLAAHMDKYGVVREFHCEDVDCPWHVCGFTTTSEWSRHTKSQHGSVLVITCEVCYKPFTRKDSLKRHTQLVHENENSRYNRRLRNGGSKKSHKDPHLH